MANALATQATITINSVSQGTVRLKRCKSSKVSDGAKTEAVTAMGEDDPVGFRDAPGPNHPTEFVVHSDHCVNQSVQSVHI